MTSEKTANVAAPTVSEPDKLPSATHPEEMIASVHAQAGAFSFRANARATPAGSVWRC